MIIWRGWGILVAIVFFACLFLENTVLKTERTGYMLVFSCFVTGIFSWFVGKFLNKVDNTHTLFFIPMQWWGIILTVAGIAIFLAEVILFKL